jgi:hypothetical protein
MLKKRALVVQPLAESYRYIALTQNQVAIVDKEDYPSLNQFHWQAQWDSRTKSFYSVRHSRTKDGRRKIIHMANQILGCGPDEEADHRNHNTLDNQKNNLRKATKSQNRWNRKKSHPKNKSGYIGVCWHKRNNKWMASIGYKGKIIHLGYFTSAEEAARARDEAAKKYHGEFAILNFSQNFPQTP